jgi:ADP-heptose:LPS heptosyltransferase
MNVLVTRTDRLGDVMMALPALAWLRAQIPAPHTISLLVKPGPFEAIAPWLAAQKITAAREPRLNEYEALLLLHFDSELAWEARKVGVRMRIGMRSKLASFFVLTDGVRQKRSRAEKNEAEYNLDLARYFLRKLGLPERDIPLPRQLIPESDVEPARRALAKLKLDWDSPFFVLHPGMGGSALNLDANTYAKLFRSIESELKLPVVLSIGPAAADQAMKRELMTQTPNLRPLEGESLSTIREVFRRAKAFIGPSTGPLHLAHYVGTPTVGIFSPVRSHHPRRWAPWGGQGESRVIAPDIDCPATARCLGEKCARYDCLTGVDWTAAVVRDLKSLLKLT